MRYRKREKLRVVMAEERRSSSSSRFKRICVFCGSSSGKKASYQDAAVELGRELVTN